MGEERAVPLAHTPPAHDPAVEGVAGLSVSAVARRLGVAAATLRTWDRRYGLSPSQRTEGAHRRYTGSDVALLERMQGFMAQGMSPGDAVRAARSPQADDAIPSGEHEQALAQVVELPRDASRPRRTGARQAVSGTALQRGLGNAAGRLDTESCARIIRSAIAERGVAWTWDQVVAPVLRAIGEKYQGRSPADEDNGIDIEHHLSHVVIRELVRVSDVAVAANARPVLLAAAPEEQHTLPLYVLAAALAERGVASRILGGRTPDAAVASAVRRLGPVAVLVWAQSGALTDLRAAVPPIRPAPLVLVGGPGWDGVDLPDDVAHPGDLVEAVTQIGHAVRPAAR
jgi:DNA-binding transcriptional MerR regulator